MAWENFSSTDCHWHSLEMPECKMAECYWCTWLSGSCYILPPQLSKHKIQTTWQSNQWDHQQPAYLKDRRCQNYRPTESWGELKPPHLYFRKVRVQTHRCRTNTKAALLRLQHGVFLCLQFCGSSILGDNSPADSGIWTMPGLFKLRFHC